jgi:two-component system, OmpR family, response regulator PhoP
MRGIARSAREGRTGCGELRLCLPLATHLLYRFVRSPRVLVVDDEKYVRGFLRDLLAAWGYEVDVAADGREGLRLLVDRAWDLLVTDLHMPGLSGLDLVEMVRLRGSALPIVMLTALTGDAAPHTERLDFKLLPKPVQIQELEAVVRGVLGDRSVMPSSTVPLD